MRFCPKCASPLDQAERTKLAIQEQSTEEEVAELKGLLEKHLENSAHHVKGGLDEETA